MLQKISNKAIGPVVATALLLVVAVVAVVGFQTWYNTYQSSLFSDLNQDSSSESFTVGVEGIYGDNLYVNAGTNLSVSQIKVDGIECTQGVGSYSGLSKINISDCLGSVVTRTPKVVIITKDKVLSEGVYLKNINSTSSITSSLSCPTGYIPVPGSGTYSTSNFCVMKYEAKNVGGIANSTAAGTPWVSLTWQQAKTNCENLGSNYHLITDDEWLTIAKNVEQVSSNWNSSIVGTGFIYSGHNDNYPSNSLAADTNDSNGYYGTADGVSSPGDGFFNNYLSNNDPQAYLGQKRTLILSNGEIIWDLSGNVYEWVNDSLASASRYHGGGQQYMSYNSDDGTGKVASNVPALKLPSSGWNADNGMGRYLDGNNAAGAYNTVNEAPDFCTSFCSSTAVFLRGSSWGEGLYTGIFSLNLNIGPSSPAINYGFRCSYTP